MSSTHKWDHLLLYMYLCSLCILINLLICNLMVIRHRRWMCYISPHTSALCTYTEVQISQPRAGASSLTAPSLSLCISRRKKVSSRVDDYRLGTGKRHLHFGVNCDCHLFDLSESSLMWSMFNSLRRSFRIFLFFSRSVCLFVPVCVCR